MRTSSIFVVLSSLVAAVIAAPIESRANPCFVVGSVALPAEVSSTLPALSAVTCNTAKKVFATVPDTISGGIAYSTIDFQKSTLSPLGFALKTFPTPADPATADVAKLQNQLNTYLAVEAGTRSLGGTAASAFLGKLKSPKFFLQFQIARVNQAKGVKVGVADTVAHQLGKVTKNSAGATAAELAALNALATVV